MKLNHCEDPIERQILKVKVLADGLLVDDEQTLEFAGLLHWESELTVIYSRNEVEAATKEAIHEEGLLQVNIPSSLKKIPPGAFEYCNQVVMVAIPESVALIGGRAFLNCKSLERITIPESVTSIEDGAFAGCTSLTSISIPESVTAIGNGAFFGCSSLENITIPESLTYIGDGAFDDKLRVENSHVWLYWFATVGTWFFTFELDSMGQCGPSDQLSIIANSRAKKIATMCVGILKFEP